MKTKMKKKKCHNQLVWAICISYVVGISCVRCKTKLNPTILPLSITPISIQFNFYCHSFTIPNHNFTLNFKLHFLFTCPTIIYITWKIKWKKTKFGMKNFKLSIEMYLCTTIYVRVETWLGFWIVWWERLYTYGKQRFSTETNTFTISRVLKFGNIVWCATVIAFLLIAFEEKNTMRNGNFVESTHRTYHSNIVPRYYTSIIFVSCSDTFEIFTHSHSLYLNFGAE